MTTRNPDTHPRYYQAAGYILNHYDRNSHADKLCLAKKIEQLVSDELCLEREETRKLETDLKDAKSDLVKLISQIKKDFEARKKAETENRQLKSIAWQLYMCCSAEEMRDLGAILQRIAPQPTVEEITNKTPNSSEDSQWTTQQVFLGGEGGDH
jgi:septal ring factor EnvC (AmiA/AmiB activator)